MPLSSSFPSFSHSIKWSWKSNEETQRQMTHDKSHFTRLLEINIYKRRLAVCRGSEDDGGLLLHILTWHIRHNMAEQSPINETAGKISIFELENIFYKHSVYLELFLWPFITHAPHTAHKSALKFHPTHFFIGLVLHQDKTKNRVRFVCMSCSMPWYFFHQLDLELYLNAHVIFASVWFSRAMFGSCLPFLSTRYRL